VRLLPRLSAFAVFVLAAAFTACGGTGNPNTGSSSSGSGGAGNGGNGGAGGALPPPKSLAIMDWNVHDFFDSINDNPEEIVLSPTDYKGKRQGIGNVVKSFAPDVVMFAEVETQLILDDLNKAELGNLYGTRVLIKGNDTRGINVGLMSKIAPDSVVSHKDDTFTKLGTNGPIYHYSRDCLEVHLTFNGRKIILLGVHFRSKVTPDDPDKRLAEAQHTRAIADDLAAKDPTAGIIVLGDYNDVPGSAPVAAVVGKAPSLFADAADVVDMANRYSFNYMGEHQLIDHQMGNAAAAAWLDPSTVIIKHGPGVDDASKYASDHAPIFAVYQVR
jgi:hypothetical protein